VDFRQAEKLAGIGCTVAEIAAVLEVSTATVERHAQEVIARGRDRVKASLRRKQVALALAGDRVMLIWLGKQMLGQREPPHEVHGAVDQPIRVVIEHIGRATPVPAEAKRV
jgi:hypothetical protein